MISDQTQSPTKEKARNLVLEYGWNSTCYQVLNDGFERWISADGESLIGYVRQGRWAIVAGAPICTQGRLGQTIEEWETFAASQDLGVIYFGAEERLQLQLADNPGYFAVTLGCQPEWSPEHFIRAIASDASLRAQCRRAINKGVFVSEWSREQAENNPALWQVLREWLATRGLPTLHFLVEPETLRDLRDRRIFVAEISGQAVGFVTLCPAPARNGWLTEQFVRGRKAPNGTIELMLRTAVESIIKDDACFVTMGIVPLSNRGEFPKTSQAPWLALARTWAIAHGNRFYNFKGLETFKNKFHPDTWEPVVVIVKDNGFKLKHLRAIVGAFTQDSPELALAKGLLKAIQTEIQRLMSFLRSR